MASTGGDGPAGARLEIAAGRQRAIVTEIGGALGSWRVGDRELLDGFGPAADFRGEVLVPWPNRMRDGRYEFGGAEHRAPINEPERHCAIHGLAGGLPWEVGEHAGGRLAVHVLLDDLPGYPFTVRVEVTYALAGDGMTVTLAARNEGAGPAPFGAGFHPYLLTGPANPARLCVPAAALVPLDGERLLPTGPPVPVAGSDRDLRAEQPLGDRAINACFTALERDGDGMARVRVVPAGEPAVTVWMDEAFGFAMVYTADDVAEPDRRRRSIAVEPMTCAPDAFNTGLGLRVLEPGEALTGRWGMTTEG